jgi:hypothetical protein
MTTPSQETPNSAVPVDSKEQSAKEFNFTQLRKQLDNERAARQQAEERASRLERERQEFSKSHDDDDAPSDEPYVDHRALDKKFKKFEANLDQRIEKKAEEKARAMVQQERQTSYLKQKNDFNEIMQPEMMQKLIDKDPELAETILEMPEGFARQKLVYHAIKAIGLHKKEENKPSIQQVIEQNKRSPYYQPSGVSSAPYAAAGDFSESGQKNAYAKLQELKSKLRL